jgi:hypothetical protein
MWTRGSSTSSSVNTIFLQFDQEYWEAAKQTLEKFYFEQFGEATLTHINITIN